MKKIIYMVLFSSLTWQVNATPIDITANVGKVRYVEANNTLVPAWSGSVWFSLLNPDTQPACAKYDGEYAIFVPKGNELALSILLTAKLSNNEVTVTVDDAVKLSGSDFCLLQYITID